MTVLNGWIDADIEQPPLVEGKDYSGNVWGWDGDTLLVVAFFNDADVWGWGNCYGDVFGDAELDDDYEILFWKNIDIPEPPIESKLEPGDVDDYDVRYWKPTTNQKIEEKK